MALGWGDYERVHADRRNLIIHLLAVPLFDVAFLCAVILGASGAYVAAGFGLLGAVAGMALQRIGHSKERFAAAPFDGPADFLKRWFAEQYFKFPAFVLTGRWHRQYKAAGHGC